MNVAVRGSKNILSLDMFDILSYQCFKGCKIDNSKHCVFIHFPQKSRTISAIFNNTSYVNVHIGCLNSNLFSKYKIGIRIWNDNIKIKLHTITSGQVKEVIEWKSEYQLYQM